MAKLILDPKSLPERIAPSPAVKPAVKSFPYMDLDHPEEADTFRVLIRELRRQLPADFRTVK
jgi:hypothetical protein